MKQYNNVYIADEDKFIVRKEDNFVMGKDICLHPSDNINNYEERKITDEELKVFKANAGISVIETNENQEEENEEL